MDISEPSALTGLAPSALRFYERRGLITPIGRADGKRIYRAGTVQQVALIDLLKISGFTLPEIAELIDPGGHVHPDRRDPARAKQEHLRRPLTDIDRVLTLLQHTTDCPRTSLHECPIHQAVVDAHADTLATSRGHVTRACRPQGRALPQTAPPLTFVLEPDDRIHHRRR